MANVIKLKKGLDIALIGEAQYQTSSTSISSIYGLLPDDYVGVKPKLVVKEGDVVRAGEPLFVNKSCPEVNFVSPVSGKVSLIQRGERRKLLSVQVEADPTIEYKTFDVNGAQSWEAEQIKKLLLASGLWAFIKQRPYDIAALPDSTAQSIYISAFSKMPLASDFSYVVKGQESEFQLGLTALSKLAKVYLGINVQQASTFLSTLKDVQINVFDGPNPSGNVGVQINHIAPINKGDEVWTIGAEEVIFIGRLLKKGIVDLTRTIAVAGAEINQPEYRQVIVGAQIKDILNEKLKTTVHTRIIDGNPLVGKKVNLDDFIGAHTTEVTAIPEGDDVHEMFGWIAPRFNDYSSNRSYFSWLFSRKKYNLDARIKGGERHLIMSGEYDKVFPMDIYPEFLIKAIITGNIDKMEALGIYEVAPEDFAVAEFVDSSKLELQRIVREGLDMLRKEMA